MRLRRLFDLFISAAGFWFVILSTGVAQEAPRSQYIRDEHSDKIIVFVHGFNEDGIETWTNGTAYWPTMLVSDPDFAGVDVFVYQYPTSINGRLTPDELSDDMDNALKANKVTDRHKILFIAHSMGGIVTRAFLLRNLDIAGRTAMVQFLATPTDGSSLANIFRILNEQQIGKMTTDISETYLGNLSRQWLAAKLSIASYCAYEKQTTFGAIVVSFESATALCNRNADPVDANHSGIAKPKDFDSQSYRIFKAHYWEIVRQLASQGQQSNGAFVANGPDGTLGTFRFDHNTVIGVPTILENQGHIGQTHIEDNFIDNSGIK